MKKLIVCILLMVTMLSFSVEKKFYEKGEVTTHEGFLLKETTYNYYVNIDIDYKKLAEENKTLQIRYDKLIKQYEDLMNLNKTQESLLLLKINALQDTNIIYKQSYDDYNSLAIKSQMWKIAGSVGLTIGISSLLGIGFYSLGQYVATVR